MVYPVWCSVLMWRMSLWKQHAALKHSNMQLYDAVVPADDVVSISPWHSNTYSAACCCVSAHVIYGCGTCIHRHVLACSFLFVRSCAWVCEWVCVASQVSVLVVYRSSSLFCVASQVGVCCCTIVNISGRLHYFSYVTFRKFESFVLCWFLIFKTLA